MSNMTKGSSTPEFLRPHDVARKLGISHSLVLRNLRNRNLPGFKLGKAWLIRSSELEHFLKQKEKLFLELDQ